MHVPIRPSVHTHAVVSNSTVYTGFNWSKNCVYGFAVIMYLFGMGVLCVSHHSLLPWVPVTALA